MKRRTFINMAISTIGALALAPSLLIAGEDLDYTPGLIKQQLAAGQTVFVDYAADWCGTCKRQERVVSQLRTANPKYDEKITFIRVDWDKYSSHAVTTGNNVPRRSTLLMLKGDKELGRIVAGTSTDEIKALLDKGI